MLVVRGTRRFLDRVGVPPVAAEQVSSTVLGDWYATVLRWRPQVALFVSETTLLPVLMPFAPARTVISRFPAVLAEVLAVRGLAAGFIHAEIDCMADVVLAPTSSRSLVGTMNEFIFLAGQWRGDELMDLSLRLAATPCGPLYQRYVCPDRELRALVQRQGSKRPR